MGNFKKYVAMAACTAMAFTMTACGSDSKEGSSNSNEVKIGLNFELTGPAATYGQTELNGVKLALKQAKENKDNKLTYTTVEGDNKSDAGESTTVGQKMISSDNVNAFIGPATSGASAAIYDLATNSKVFVISPSATQTGITSKKDGSVYDYVYRVCFEDAYQGAAMAVYAKDTLGKTKAAILSDSTNDYAKGLEAAFEEKFKEKGGEIVSKSNYVAKDTDFNSALTKIKNSGADILYIPGYYTEVGSIIKQAREMGIDTPIVGGDGFDSTDLVKLAGNKEYLNDVYFTTAYTTVGASDELKAFIEAYKAEYGEDPSMFSALAYDSTNLLIQAYEEAGSTDAEAVKAAMDKVSFKGITGDFTFDETHTPKKTALVVKLIDGEQKEAVQVDPTK